MTCPDRATSSERLFAIDLVSGGENRYSSDGVVWTSIDVEASACGVRITVGGENANDFSEDA